MTEVNGFKLSMAEFKGTVVQSLEDIKEDMREIKLSNSSQHRDFYKRIGKLERTPSLSVNPISWLMSLFGMRGK